MGRGSANARSRRRLIEVPIEVRAIDARSNFGIYYIEYADWEKDIGDEMMVFGLWE
jgi:hypothetical protein